MDRPGPMPHVIRIHKHGGPEVMQWEEVQLGQPGPGEARIRQTAVGLNYADVYSRSGLYPGSLPMGLGSEAAGVVEAVGAGVTDLKPGDRVAYGSAPIGAPMPRGGSSPPTVSSSCPTPSLTPWRLR
jgi:NADPH:quinone reductase